MQYVVRKSGLIAPSSFAEPVQRDEIATIAGGRDITRGFVHPMLLLPTQDSILRARGNGNYRIYREVLRDDTVKAAFQQRQLAVVSRDWEVVPGGESPREEEAAALLREQLDQLEFDRLTTGMLYGVFYGYAVAEVLWAPAGNRVMIDQIRVRDRERFRFDGSMQLRLITASNAQGELLPERKFWHYATGADHDDEPYGLGLAHWCYWPVFFKRGGIKLWLTFLDKFGAPTVKGEYPAGASDVEKNKLLQALEAIHSESGVIIPEGMAVELLEAARSGEGGYTELYDRMDSAIAKVIVGQTATVEGTPGKLGGDEEQGAVRADLAKADADLICSSFNRSVAKWLTFYNFGPDVAPPMVWRKMESDTRSAEASIDKELHSFGYKPTAERVEEVYGEGYEPASESPGAPSLGFAEPRAARRAHQEDDDQIEDEAEYLSAQWERLLGRRVEQLLAYAEESSDLEEFRRKLRDLAASEPDAEMRETLARAGFVGRLWGAYRGRRDVQ